MQRSPKPENLRAFGAQKALNSAVFVGPRAFVALLLTLLQLLSALHFTLVPHTFSAALGGIVHVHALPDASAESNASDTRRPEQRTRANQSPSYVSDALGCAADLCPFADAPASWLPQVALLPSGVAAFGEALLLGTGQRRHSAAQRVFLSAPKTSPPV